MMSWTIVAIESNISRFRIQISIKDILFIIKKNRDNHVESTDAAGLYVKGGFQALMKFVNISKTWKLSIFLHKGFFCRKCSF